MIVSAKEEMKKADLQESEVVNMVSFSRRYHNGSAVQKTSFQTLFVARKDFIIDNYNKSYKLSFFLCVQKMDE